MAGHLAPTLTRWTEELSLFITKLCSMDPTDPVYIIAIFGRLQKKKN